VIRWVCKKVAQNAAKTIFRPFLNYHISLFPWSKAAQKFGLLLKFSKGTLRKQSPHRRQFAQSGHPDLDVPQGKLDFISFWNNFANSYVNLKDSGGKCSCFYMLLHFQSNLISLWRYVTTPSSKMSSSKMWTSRLSMSTVDITPSWRPPQG
jgi:hypothetical protein